MSGPDVERPDLERLVGYGCVMGLGEGDFVEKPVGAGVFGEVLRAFGVEDVAVEAMAKELFAAGELREVGGAERLFALRIELHDDLLCCVLAAQDRRSWRESRPERSGVHLGLDRQLRWGRSSRHRSFLYGVVRLSFLPAAYSTRPDNSRSLFCE